MNKRIKILLTYILLIAISIACDETTIEPEKQPDAELFSMKEIEIPEGLTNSTDGKAIIARTNIQVLNSLPNIYGAWLTVPNGSEILSKINDGRTYTWTRGTVSVTMNYTDSGDDIYREIILSGSDEGQTFTNYKFLESRQRKDKSEGYFKLFEVDGTVISNWVWNTTSDNIYSMIFISEDGDKIVINSNPDKSGELLFYEDNVLVSSTTWTSAGTGEWTEFDSAGNITDSGTF